MSKREKKEVDAKHLLFYVVSGLRSRLDSNEKLFFYVVKDTKSGQDFVIV